MILVGETDLDDCIIINFCAFPYIPNIRTVIQKTAQVSVRTYRYPQSHLKPELPEDIAVHFHISSSLLVLSILAISQAPKLSAAVRPLHPPPPSHPPLCLL